MLSFSSFKSVKVALLDALLMLPKPRDERSRLLRAALSLPKLFFLSLLMLFWFSWSSFLELLNSDKLVMDLLLHHCVQNDVTSLKTPDLTFTKNINMLKGCIQCCKWFMNTFLENWDLFSSLGVGGQSLYCLDTSPNGVFIPLDWKNYFTLLW